MFVKFANQICTCNRFAILKKNNKFYQINSVFEQLSNRLWRSARKPLKERLRIISEKPFDINLKGKIKQYQNM
jgi:hypothetical protein